MDLIKSLCAALSMYTIVPMPPIEWNKKSLKYILALFPFCGIMPALALYLLQLLRTRIWVYLPENIFYMGAAIAPAIVTGGIHLDGYMDTSDALFSHADREKKLQIMDDPHVGAGAVMAVAIYYIAYMGALSMIGSRRQVLLVMTGFFMSRALSAIAMLTMPGAKDRGLGATFRETEGKKLSLVILTAWVIACVFAAYYIMGRWGSAVIGAGLLVFFLYEYIAMKEFGGITGDTAGWFLCIYELFYTLLCGIVGLFWFV